MGAETLSPPCEMAPQDAGLQHRPWIASPRATARVSSDGSSSSVDDLLGTSDLP
jgi:hypothetical protein